MNYVLLLAIGFLVGFIARALLYPKHESKPALRAEGLQHAQEYINASNPALCLTPAGFRNWQAKRNALVDYIMRVTA